MSEQAYVREITDKSKDISRWYTDVVLKAELADYSPVRGTMVIRPYGYSIWENIQRELDRRFRDTGHQNAYFPLLIPESFLLKEAEHVAGFAPQVAWVTQGGDEELTERLAIRPTSEAIIGYMYSKWIQSWRDLPVLINQWANIVRWEKETRFFLRTMEFLWQEGHTVHATLDEAEEETLRMLGVYKAFAEEFLSIPVVAGRKTESEKFAGALRTYSIEALMPDGKALQAGTSHNLGQNFSHAFDITFLDRDGQRKFAWQTSWGVSTRLMGGLIMAHGDDSGLVLPPRVAPIQVVVVPIGMKETADDPVAQLAAEVEERLRKAQIRVQVDRRPEYTPGWKFNEWEMRGVPLRLEIGPREVERRQVFTSRRDTRAKRPLPMNDLEDQVGALLETFQSDLLEKGRQFVRQHTSTVSSFDEFKRALAENPGFVRSLWCGRAECEARIKDETAATIRNLPFDEPEVRGKCVCCGEEAATMAWFAKAY